MNLELAARVWELSERVTGIRYEDIRSLDIVGLTQMLKQPTSTATDASNQQQPQTRRRSKHTRRDD